MTDTASLLTLMSWLSPAFPIGGFAYSAGLEEAVANEYVRNADDLQGWISGQVHHGALWTDAVIFAASYHQEKPTDEIAALARALCISAERLTEMNDQGAAFADAAQVWLGANNRDWPLAVGVGHAAAALNIPLDAALAAYLHAFVSNQLQAAIRISVLGQKGAAAILMALEPEIKSLADKAAISTLDDLGSAGFLADIAAMNHEILQPRLFRS